MSSVGPTATPQAPAPTVSARSRRGLGGGAPGARLRGASPGIRHLGFVIVVAASAVLNTHRLAQNGYANIFYSAGDRSMLRSLHNFFFVSFDPGGLVSVDKPPLALWLQAASAKLFGFSPLSLLLPEAIAGVLAVAVLYIVLVRRLGTFAAFTGALAMAVFPSFVAVSRENSVDPVLILMLVLACAAGVRASESGRWRGLLASAVFVGLAFNTKTLAAYLVVPGIALAFLLCAPGTILRRLLQLAVAGLVMAVVSFAWIGFVDLTPAAKRPYVGSSTNNTEIGLTFEYNGFGRVGGQSGGPGTIVVKPGGRVPAHHSKKAGARSHAPPPPAKPLTVQSETNASSTDAVGGRDRYPIPFGGSPGPLRLFGKGLGDQAGWMLPFAVFGLLALALVVLLDPRRAAAAQTSRSSPDATAPAAPAAPGGEAGADAPATARAPVASLGPPGDPVRGKRVWIGLARRDPRLIIAIVLGGWFFVEAAVLSTSKGIVHPYYVSALAPGTGAMTGAGVYAIMRLARGEHRVWGILLVALAAVATVATQLALMHRYHYMIWYEPILLGGAIVGLGAIVALRRLAGPGLALMLAALLAAPTAYAASTWLAPVEGTFPAAGPKQSAGPGGYGVNTRNLGIDRALAEYVHSHHPGTRWELLTVASDTAAPIMLLGYEAGALGGYSGTDPALDGPGLGRLVARGEARYVLLGGEYSLRGGNRATAAVLRVCRELKPSQWHSPIGHPYGLTLFDCAGDARKLASA